MTSRVLVVDDVAANVRLLESRLQAEYFDVRTALSGTEALEIAERERVDLVLLDVMMPDMTGFEVCAKLKADPRTAHVPVVMVTSLDQAEDRVKGLECGADDFLSKPVSDIALVTRVKSLVRLKMVTDELELRAAALESVGLSSASVFADSSRSPGASSSSTIGRTRPAPSGRRCRGRSRSRSRASRPKPSRRRGAAPST